MRTPITASVAGIAALCGMATVALAIQPPQQDRLASCVKSVNALGAEISRSQVRANDGGEAYQFVVRANGIDYRVKCDPATGVVGDVTPVAGQN